jgi:hypothetical protein
MASWISRWSVVIGNLPRSAANVLTMNHGPKYLLYRLPLILDGASLGCKPPPSPLPPPPGVLPGQTYPLSSLLLMLQRALSPASNDNQWCYKNSLLILPQVDGSATRLGHRCFERWHVILILATQIVPTRGQGAASGDTWCYHRWHKLLLARACGATIGNTWCYRRRPEMLLGYDGDAPMRASGDVLPVVLLVILHGDMGRCCDGATRHASIGWSSSHGLLVLTNVGWVSGLHADCCHTHVLLDVWPVGGEYVTHPDWFPLRQDDLAWGVAMDLICIHLWLLRRLRKLVDEGCTIHPIYPKIKLLQQVNKEEHS